MNFDFLTSRRFWALVIACIVYGLKTAGTIPLEVAAPLEAFLLGFIGIRTVDRFAESIGK